jgi:hypothetical protein
MTRYKVCDRCGGTHHLAWMEHFNIETGEFQIHVEHCDVCDEDGRIVMIDENVVNGRKIIYKEIK